MDEYAGYDQVKMAIKNKENTTFIMEWGTYCYNVMSFDINTVGAIYQRNANLCQESCKKVIKLNGMHHVRQLLTKVRNT